MRTRDLIAAYRARTGRTISDETVRQLTNRRELPIASRDRFGRVFFSERAVETLIARDGDRDDTSRSGGRGVVNVK